MARTYPVSTQLNEIFAFFEIDPTALFATAGIDPPQPGEVITARKYFALTNIFLDAAIAVHSPVKLGCKFAEFPGFSPMLALACSPNILVGLQRFAELKQILTPVRVSFETTPEAVSVTLCAQGFDQAQTDPRFWLCALVEIMHLSRVLTGRKIVPQAVALPQIGAYELECNRFFGIALKEADRATLRFAMADALLPTTQGAQLLNPAQQQILRADQAHLDQNVPIEKQLKDALRVLLPAGRATIDFVADALLTSKRSLQRKLKARNLRFHDLLEATRAEMSLELLSRQELRIEEISYLLAYRDPNSFYRAFNNWTGKTPAQMRQTLKEAS